MIFLLRLLVLRKMWKNVEIRGNAIAYSGN